VPRYEGKLELTWTNKDQSLLAHEDGSYEWLPPSDYRVAEVRLLNDVRAVGQVGKRRAADNLLIEGDALNALTSLLKLPEFRTEYAGKIKLAYIDPPFNTLQSFLQYDDALEHSVWLTMMRDRLAQIHALLADDGSVWVHLDDAEAHRCRIVLDEVFGPGNFIATVVWARADSPRNSARHFSTDQDYIHIYAKNANVWRPVRLPRTAESDASYRNPDNDPRGPWTPGDPFANKPYALGRYEVTGPTGNTFEPPRGRYWRISKEKFEEMDAEGRIYWRGGGDARPRIKRYLSEVGDLVPRTLWDFTETGSSGDASREIRKLFPGLPVFATPKPEKLLHRIIGLGSEPGDIVLDCFVGSGTTAAVAQKMGRRWIAVERSKETVETFAEPRLAKVVDGSDRGGISAAAEWSGGGGFRLIELSPSMFEEDEGLIFLAEGLTNGALAEATAAQLGFTYVAEPPFAGRKGRSRLAVIDGVVSEGVVRLLTKALNEGERVVICGTGVDPDVRNLLQQLAAGSTMRKIPSALLERYRREGRAQQPLPLASSSQES